MSVQGRDVMDMARQAKTKEGRHCATTRSKGGRQRRLMRARELTQRHSTDSGEGLTGGDAPKESGCAAMP
eukprot:1527822-Pleurochrysis_carterae.AAC.1